jgi:putative phosphoribosyl transferase
MVLYFLIIEAILMKIDFSQEKTVKFSAGIVELEGSLTVPENAKGMVLFAHGSGSSRHSSRNKYVANDLNESGLATLLIDLLTSQEEELDNQTRHIRFDLALLAGRLVGAAEWLKSQEETKDLKIGLFGASTGGGAALITAQKIPGLIRAVVSRGGRPDLAGPSLPDVKAPVLLIVGGNDFQVIEMNNEAFARLRCEKQMIIVPGATHLFEESGKLEKVAGLAKEWFLKYLSPA